MCALLENTVEAGLFLMIILHVLSISWVPFHAQSGSLYVSKNTGMLSVQKAGLDMLTPSWQDLTILSRHYLNHSVLYKRHVRHRLHYLSRQVRHLRHRSNWA